MQFDIVKHAKVRNKFRYPWNCFLFLLLNIYIFFYNLFTAFFQWFQFNNFKGVNEPTQCKFIKQQLCCTSCLPIRIYLCAFKCVYIYGYIAPVASTSDVCAFALLDDTGNNQKTSHPLSFARRKHFLSSHTHTHTHRCVFKWVWVGK